MPVALYLRVSTEEQRERQSIVTQRDFGQRYCELHQLPVYEIFADDGVSGTVPIESRPAGKRVLAAARQGKFDQLLVFKLDRLGRETRLILNSVAELEKHGVRIRSMTEEFDTATATGRLMLTMLSGFAAHEREVIRERSVAGTNRCAEAGAWLGGVVPYAYRKEGEKGQGRLVINDEKIRLKRTMLAGFAAHERERMRERSVAGTNRCAEAGAWLGGVVPYAYRKEGEKGQGRLVINDEKIPGFEISEADVVRTIYCMSAVEKKSCQNIADHLHRTGIPCTSARNTENAATGKRNRRIAAMWRSSHVRNMIANRTYMGEHLFGKRTKNPKRKVIVRAVPAIVTEETWNRAQQVLRSNQMIAKRNVRTPFLMRGLIKCGLCILTFSGARASARHPAQYYHCNGRQFARGLYGLPGKKCPGKSINGEYVERVIWADIESFLRDPGEILERLRERLSMKGNERQRQQKELEQLRDRLEEKTTERERMLGLFRRGRIDDATLDQHLDLINAETAGCKPR